MDHLGHDPVALGQLAKQLAIGRSQLQVTEAGALRAAQDAAVGERAGVLVDVQPWLGLLRPQLRGAPVRLDAEPAQGSLVTGQDRHQPAAARLRDHARQVVVLGCAQVDFHDPAPVDGRDPQRDPRVRPAGERVAVLLVLWGGGAKVGDGESRQVPLVDVGEGEMPAVTAPPHPVVAIELLGGHELGQAVEDAGLGVMGQATGRRAAIQGRRPQVAIAHERDVPAIRRDRDG